MPKNRSVKHVKNRLNGIKQEAQAFLEFADNVASSIRVTGQAMGEIAATVKVSDDLIALITDFVNSAFDGGNQ